MDHDVNYILRRRSIRKYENKMLEPKHFELLLSAAMAAPSARRTDPWEFLIINDKERLAKLAQFLPNAPFLPETGGAIVVCGDLKKAYIESLSYMLQDCSAAIENILLAAPAIGLGGCWLGIHPREERIAAVKEFFGLPENIIPVGACALGFPAEELPERSRYDESKIHVNFWN
jgi:nitroreductase